MAPPKIYLFIDNSNIFISAKDEAEKREGARHQVRLAIEHLLQLATAGRAVGKVCIVGSIPPEDKAIWDKFEEVTGVKPELYERGAVSKGEQGLDQCLQVHMLRAISDNDEPQIAIVMTGDGAGYDDGVGFHADMERMYEAGWGVEVISWRGHCKRALREWATDKGVFVDLDAYYDAVTFVKGGRPAAALDLSSRGVAQTRLSPTQEAEKRIRAEASAKQAAAEKRIQELEAALAKKAKGKEKHDKRFNRRAKN